MRFLGHLFFLIQRVEADLKRYLQNFGKKKHQPDYQIHCINTNDRDLKGQEFEAHTQYDKCDMQSSQGEGDVLLFRIPIKYKKCVCHSMGDLLMREDPGRIAF